MIDLEKTGKRIALLRRERGFTGEELAERLHVSPQAISKWENARCLPETAILPALAGALECSIDSLLLPREFFVLEAVYTDGQTHIPVTHFIDNMVRDNALNIYVNSAFTGASLESDRLKMLIVKYQTPEGIYFTYALQNENLLINKESIGHTADKPFQLIGAYYGNGKSYSSVLQKMNHYEYFKWDRIAVNHENFPSNTASDETEYLTLVYLNAEGIHAISCAEDHVLCYGDHRTRLLPEDQSRCVLKDIIPLSWGEGMDCPWAGALYAALRFMGEPYTYHQIMGMSGACYRICFTDVWDYSCTDALVAFDYATPFFKNLGYSFRVAERLEKQERQAERAAIMKDIRNGRPVLAINLRVAPEWGVITGYTDNGSRFLCRTYFDREVFAALEQEDSQNREERRIVFEENGGYLYGDFWPFLIMHIGEKGAAPSPLSALKTSLDTLIRSFHAKARDCYHQGREAYKAWIKGLEKESDFLMENDEEAVRRRLDVNDNMLCNLIDARSAAAAWLRENIPLLSETGKEYLTKIADNCQVISDTTAAFRQLANHLPAGDAADHTITFSGVSTPELRARQAGILEDALALDEENCRLAEWILALPEMQNPD